MHMIKSLTIRCLLVFCILGSAQMVVVADPIVIAHRGASGYLPEHTLEAYAVAHAMGADYIEPDLVMTKDGVLICLHDVRLDQTTNVKEVFPDRKRGNLGWYAIDFTLREIKQLRVFERTSNRFPKGASKFEVPTFTEMIELVQGLNKTTGREVGIYPETKAPTFHRDEGLPMEGELLEILDTYGYSGKYAKVFIQSFEFESLERIRKDLRSELPLIMLLGEGAESVGLSPSGLDRLEKVVNGVGPSKLSFLRVPNLVEIVHARGLLVHPYTFRSDSYPKERYNSFSEELNTFFNEYKVDGVFTDHPDKVRAFLNN